MLYSVRNFILLAGFILGLVNASPNNNPFKGTPFYVNPTYQASLDTSIASATGTVKSTLQSMRNVPSAYWIDVKAKVNTTVPQILADAASKNPSQLVLFIVYDVPNRDCHAKASNGEICCYKQAGSNMCDYERAGDCADGLADYEKNYIDPLAALFAQYQNKVPIVLVIEPDSLPNLATNTADPRCGNSATETAYKSGISYAIKTFATKAPKVTMYIDAAHGGWLGWPTGSSAFVKTISDMGVIPYIRGFATNVANYQPLGSQCPSIGFCLNNANPNHPCCSDPCRLASAYNPANNEMNYVAVLGDAFSKAANFNPHFIVDTGRNGGPQQRTDCGNWCNIRGAGVGLIPTSNTGFDAIDAFFWLKTPGESDGCTQVLPDGTQCPRFDSMCSSGDSIGSRNGEPRAPEAGKWFDYQVKQLAQNAHLGGPAPAPAPGSGSGPAPAPGSGSGPAPGSGSGSGPAPGRPAPAPSNPGPAPGGGNCAALYGQCGGNNWNGPKCCASGTCRVSNEWYSQCL